MSLSGHDGAALDGGPVAKAATTAAPTRSSRLTFALRQAATLGGCLVLGGLVVERLRPEAAGDRGFISTPFFWAAGVWAALLLLDALAFRHSQVRRLDRSPLAVGGIAGVLVFLVGLAQFSAGTTGGRLSYLLGNAIGAAVFWWGIAGVALLLWHLATEGSNPSVSTGATTNESVSESVSE